MLREIHVSSAAFGGGEDVDWHFDDEKSLPDLPGLMTLQISVNFRFPVLDAYDRFKKHSEELTGHDWNQALLRFQVLSLEKATVVINDYTFCFDFLLYYPTGDLYNAIEKRHRLTVHEK